MMVGKETLAIHYLEMHDEDYQMLWMKYQNRFDYAQDYN